MGICYIVFIYMISMVSSGRGVAMVIGALCRRSSSEYIVTMDTVTVPHTYVLRDTAAVYKKIYIRDTAEYILGHFIFR